MCFQLKAKVPTVDVVVNVVKIKSWLWLKHLLKGFVTISFVEWESNRAMF